MITLLWIICCVILIFVVGFFRVSLLLSTVLFFVYLFLLTVYTNFSLVMLCIDALFVALAIMFNVKPLRRLLFTKHVLKILKASSPPLSKTEEQALTAGSVSFEGEIFSGKPDFTSMLAQKPAQLSKEEQAFLDGPTEELCLMVDDWQIYQDKDLSKEAWQFIKDKGFLSMIIPKKYGGLEFSAAAHSAVILKLGSRNLPAAISVGVPNSLGPAELILRYGTEEQKDYYLSRLARGDEIPCFALTGPTAGSDAASIPDFGILCYQEFNGTKTLGIRLNFEKRYITMAPIATVIGLAFKFYDPDHLLFEESYQGITCALIPRNLPGIEIGKRHIPQNIMFQNGPVSGRDVFIPLDYVIGGQAMIGQGWRMLMECLGAGRGITLPSAGSGNAMVAALTSGCYARIRHQFRLPIGRFEGVQEVLARIGANAYVNLSALKFILASIDRGEEPAVASAIVKYHTTERARQAVNDAMDIHGGKGICLGPKNYLSFLYDCLPINITVEGANILTRNVIIFGQGSLRCHPYLLKELKATADNDPVVFDDVFVKHMGFLLQNLMRSIFRSLTNAFVLRGPRSLLRRRFNQITRYSTNFALLVDAAVITIRGGLKRKENISSKLGDLLSNMYLATACLKRFHDDNQPKEDLPIVEYICDHLFHDIEQTMKDVCHNLPNKMIGFVLRCICLPWGITQNKPLDQVGQKVAALMLYPNPSFARMTDGIFKTDAGNNFFATLMRAQEIIVAMEKQEKMVSNAKEQRVITGLTEIDLINDAKQKGIISDSDANKLLEVAKLRAEIISVDEF